MKRQTDGELDDTRLTEGLTGEAAVYKRRGMAKPELGRPQVKCVLPCALRGVVQLTEMGSPGRSAFGSCLILAHQCGSTRVMACQGERWSLWFVWQVPVPA